MLLLGRCLILCHLWHGFGEESLKKIGEGINNCTLPNSQHMAFVTSFCLWPQGPAYTLVYAQVHHLDVEQLFMWVLTHMWVLVSSFVNLPCCLWWTGFHFLNYFKYQTNYSANYFKEAGRKIRVYDWFLNGRKYSWTLFHQPFLVEYAFNSQL